VIGGMLAASIIGIFFIPAIFYIVERSRAPKRMRRVCCHRVLRRTGRLRYASIIHRSIHLGRCFDRCVGEFAPWAPTIISLRSRPRIISGPRRDAYRRRRIARGSQNVEVFKDEKLQDLEKIALTQNTTYGMPWCE